MNWIDHGKYFELNIPQGDQGWLEGRIGRVTTSVSGGLAGNSRFKTPEEQGLIIAGMQESFTEEAIERMNHGTRTEPDARKWYAKKSGYKVVERGLIVPKWDYRLGASVDGDVIGTDGIIEIKCPVRMYKPLSWYSQQIQAGWEPPSDYYRHIWPTHYDQMQHAMAVMDKKWCVYIVYAIEDQEIFTQTIPFNPSYWSQHYKTLIQNYNKYVVPNLKPNYPICP